MNEPAVPPSKWLSRLVALAAVLLPCIGVVAFFLLDHAHQKNDEGSYLIQAQAAFVALRDQGIFRSLSYILFDRTFRPILHPFLATPFFIPTLGHAERAVEIYILFAYVFFLGYVFRFLRRYVELWEALLATWLIALCPAFVQRTEGFNSELSYLAVAVGFLYHLDACEFFSEKRQSLLAGIFLALCLCIRPTETLMLSVLLGGPYLFVAYRKSILSVRDLIAATAALAGSVAVMGLQVAKPLWPADHNAVYLVAAVFPLIPLVFSKRLKLAAAFWSFYGTAVALTAFWYAPVMGELYNWLWLSAFSQVAKNTGMREGITRLQFFARVGVAVGAPLLLAMLVLGALNWASARKYLPKALFVVPAVLFPAVIGSFSLNGDTRFYLVPALIAFLAVLVLALAPTPYKLVSWLRFAALLAVVLVLADYRSAVLQRHWDQVHSYEHWLQGPDMRAPDPSDPVDDVYTEFLSKLHQVEPAPERELQVCILQLRQYNDLDWAADPYALTVMSAEHREKFNFWRPWPYAADTVPGKFEYVRNECDYVFVLPLKHTPNAPIEHFMSDVGERVLTDWKKKDLARDELRLVGQGKYHGYDVKTTGDYLLFRSLRRNPEKRRG